MKYYEAVRQSEESQQAGCGCLAFLLQSGAIVWLLSSQLGILKALLVSFVMTLTTWVLAFMGIIPVIGQWIYRQFAEEVIVWVCGLLGVNPNFQLQVPNWINFILKWILGGDEVLGTLVSFTFAGGYALTILVSIGVGIVIILTIVRRILLNRA